MAALRRVLWLLSLQLHLHGAVGWTASQLPAQRPLATNAEPTDPWRSIFTAFNCSCDDPQCGYDGGDHLTLPEMKCSGTISDEICNMMHLQVFEVKKNELTGKLPACLGKLEKLKELRVYGNPIEGELPALGNLQQLKTLKFKRLKLTGGLPDWLCGLRQLTELNLKHNRLQGELPECLSELTNLTRLSLGRNYLSGNLSSLGALKNLKLAKLHRNLFEGDFGDWVCELGQLEHFNINYNNLSGVLPTCIGELTKLRLLGLGRNSLSGKVPSTINNLQNLKILWLHRSNFEGDVPFMGNLQKLKELWLHENSFSGEPLEQFCSMQKLEDLRLDSNNFSGHLPECFGSMSQLKQLRIARNALEGEIPRDLLISRTLQILSIEDNRLSGSLPARLSMTDLETLSLANNSLEGRFPKLENMTKLVTLSVADNDFIGDLPSLEGLPSLQTLSVANNWFTGKLPNLSMLQSLRTIVAHGNNFQGLFPNISQLPSLQQVIAHDNFFEGHLPVLPPMVKTVLLHGNRFHGLANHLGSNATRLDLVLAVAGNYLDGPVSRNISSKEPLLENNAASTLLVDVDSDVQHELSLIGVTALMAVCLFARRERWGDCQPGEEGQLSAFTEQVLSRCQKRMALQCCVAFSCLCVYIRSHDLLYRQGGLAPLMSNATYRRGALMIAAYFVVLVYNSSAFVWILKFPRSNANLNKQRPSWLQRVAAWLGLLLVVVVCSCPSLVNSALDCYPEPWDMFVSVKTYLPAVGALLNSVLLPKLVLWIGSTTGIPPQRLSVLQSLGSWVLPCMLLVVMSEDCYGAWWHWMPDCGLQRTWSCYPDKDGDNVCESDARFDIPYEGGNWAYNGSHYLQNVMIVSREDICETRWVHPGKCTARLLDVVGAFLLKKMMVAAMLTMIFLAMCMYGKAEWTWSVCPDWPCPLGLVTKRDDAEVEHMDLVFWLPFTRGDSMKLLCVTSMFSPAAVTQRVAIWVDLSFGWGLLNPSMSFASLLYITIELLAYKTAVRKLKLRFKQKEEDVQLPKGMMILWLAMMTILAALHLVSSASDDLQGKHVAIGMLPGFPMFMCIHLLSRRPDRKDSIVVELPDTRQARDEVARGTMMSDAGASFGALSLA
eukprot:TRINITY_DN41614_c0_g1_i1.p1 TRINITY_DN41614_c0_g1~~TRINITY_DN41614_c0_g1_i1.p1  ORF type:complete len:1115 (-),score=132.85 TRINITY_DN41614_c0_g1_i1:256-3600(-)